VLLVKLHLYIGLWLGALFVLLGLTGTVLSWRHEIDAALNPELLVASAPVSLPLRADAVQQVVARLKADPQYGKPRMLMLPV
ncbi:PepSY-associated TM helix domain-containing protein, partial [Acinetobacter baumannii]